MPSPAIKKFVKEEKIFNNFYEFFVNFFHSWWGNFHNLMYFSFFNCFYASVLYYVLIFYTVLTTKFNFMHPFQCNFFSLLKKINISLAKSKSNSCFNDKKINSASTFKQNISGIHFETKNLSKMPIMKKNDLL